MDIKTKKFGNVEFRIDEFNYTTKQEFMKAYRNESVFKFDRQEAWNYLKQFVKK